MHDPMTHLYSLLNHLSFHVAEPNSFSSSHQVTFEVVGVGPGRVGEIILVVGLDLLELLLLLVVHRHQLHSHLLVNR